MIKDIRTIILCKGAALNTNKLPPIFVYSPCIENYTVFGDYDSLSIYKIDYDSNFLITMRDNNTKIRSKISDNCVILPSNVILSEEFNYSQQEIEAFWNKSSAYFGYTAIWLNINAQYELYSSDTFAKIKQVLSSKNGLLYKAIEHSGYVFFWKTDDLAIYSQIVKKLSQIEEVGYYETIISMNDKYPIDKVKSTPISKITIDVLGTKRIFNDEIIRKIVHIFDKNVKIEEINTNLVGAGISQFVFKDICFEQLKEYSLLMRDIDFQSSNKKCCKLYISDFSGMSNYTADNFGSIIHDKYTELFAKYNNILSKLDRFDGGIKSLGQLICFLLNLSFNCRYTFLCLLLYNGIMYILDTIEKISIYQDNIDSLVNQETYFLHRILRGCWTLIENINNQSMINCTQNLYNPIFYQMNIGLLEYYNGFFNKVLCYLNVVDGNDNKTEKVSCLIVPQICRRIKTYISEEPAYDNFLFVDVPIDMIFDPSITIKSLVHEISHQWGDNFRCREKRVERFLECISNEISYRLGIWNNKVSDVIYSYLNKETSSHSEKKRNVRAVLFIDELADRSLARIKNNVNAPDFLTELIVTFFDDVRIVVDVEAKEIISNVQKQHIKMLARDEYQEIISDLYIFFRECYADLFLIFLLDISLEEYLEIVKYEIKNENYAYAGIEMLVQRFVFVILSLPDNKQDSIKKLDSNSIFVKDIKILHKYLSKVFLGKDEKLSDSEQEFLSFCYNYETSKLIVDYLKECWKKMESDSNNNERIELKKMFECAINPDKIFSNDYFKYLNETYKYIIEHQIE